ncbi:hypothetical protein F5Y17DRAFT_439784 [Xylariaceae sp. FL0594]|nr:hypothetical protein F5Y17DRAFT_439784 [Xylariaceae sp. FL0594]
MENLVVAFFFFFWVGNPPVHRFAPRMFCSPVQLFLLPRTLDQLLYFLNNMISTDCLSYATWSPNPRCPHLKVNIQRPTSNLPRY